MKRIDLNCTSSPNFIGAWRLDNLEVCTAIIDFFEDQSPAHKAGETLSGVEKEIKNSTDLSINPKELKNPSHLPLAAYIDGLFECYQDYLEQWPFLATILPEIDIGQFNVQKYGIGDHFAGVHSERVSLESAHRIFAWMTYLNDVDSGGQTHFNHYDLSVAPECGKTLIWPAEWTHAHSGKVVTSGVKYIITGWMHFPHHPKGP